MYICQDARSVTADTASCAVLKLNSTLGRAMHEVESFSKQFKEVFVVTEEKLSELSKKLPSQLTQQATEAAAQMRQRGVLPRKHCAMHFFAFLCIGPKLSEHKRK